MLNKKLLLIGPISPPLGGEALAFRVVVDLLYTEKGEVKIIDKSKYKGERLFFLRNTFYYIFKIFQHLFSVKYIYLTSSSTNAGFIRDFFTIIVSYILGIKVIIHAHSNAYLSVKNVFVKKINNLTLKYAFRLIALSPNLKTEYIKILSSEKILVINNSLYPNTPNIDFSSIEKWHEQKDLGFNIVYLSHVLPTKGIFNILEALCQLDIEGYNFTFYFAGSYFPEENYSVDEIKSKIEVYKNILKNKFVVVGFLKNEEKWELLKKTKIFILPTYFSSEGYPISLIEAMYAGNFIVSTAWRGIPEIMSEPENGFFVEINNSNNIYKTLLYLYNNADILTEVGYHNHFYAKNKYSPIKFKSAILDLFNNLC